MVKEGTRVYVRNEYGIDHGTVVKEHETVLGMVLVRWDSDGAAVWHRRDELTIMQTMSEKEHARMASYYATMQRAAVHEYDERFPEGGLT